MKIRKSIYLPLILLIYFAFMAIYFGQDLIKSGKNIQFYITCGAELIVIVALYFFLRKKEKLKEERENNESV